MADEILLFGVRIELWAIVISIFAIIFTLLKDFILPIFFKPKLDFNYEESRPYRRTNVRINNIPNVLGTFLRFKVRNSGRRPAMNCRCQIFKIEDNTHQLFEDYQGFPLRWGSRPESTINQASGERLNIGVGETEFIDIGITTNKHSNIVLQKYHSVPIGIPEIIPHGEYYIYLLFSGDNFKPYTLVFRINKPDNTNPNDIDLELENTYH